NTRIRPDDVNEQFWDRHRTTPKAYVTLKTGQELWRSRFGDLTSFRIEKPAGPPALLGGAGAYASFVSRLSDNLKPAAGGFVFDDVKGHALRASSGGTDFAMLFLGFSFFLILSALLLVGLLFRLNLDRRAAQVGVLLASGWPRRAVRRLLL